MAKHLCNLSAHRIIEISSFLRITHVVPRDQERIVFYVNNYIGWDQFNQLYALNWLEKVYKMQTQLLGSSYQPQQKQQI